MKKLYFRYGAMTAGKTMSLIAVAKNYELQHKEIEIFKACPYPMDGNKVFLESRDGKKKDEVIGLYTKCLLRLTDSKKKYNCILVDEAQFLTREQVDEFREYTIRNDTPVICYGLRTDYAGNLFEGSKRLLEIADSIEEIKTICEFCDKKAVMNLRISGGDSTVQVEKMGHKNYSPACYQCWKERKC